MKKLFITVIFLVGIALIIMGIALLIRPQWLGVRGGWLILFGIIFVSVTGLGEGLKNWVDIFFVEDKNRVSNKNSQPKIGIMKNILFGKNKIRIDQKESQVSENLILGENELVVDGSPESSSVKKKDV